MPPSSENWLGSRLSGIGGTGVWSVWGQGWLGSKVSGTGSGWGLGWLGSRVSGVRGDSLPGHLAEEHGRT